MTLGLKRMNSYMQIIVESTPILNLYEFAIENHLHYAWLRHIAWRAHSEKMVRIRRVRLDKAPGRALLIEGVWRDGKR